MIAGEASGDILGGYLMQSLKKITGDQVTFSGIGGEKMQQQGLESLFPMQELSIMGLLEIIPHIPNIRRRLRKTIRDIKNKKPLVLVTIDAPGFTKRVVKELQDTNVICIHYVAPTVWAWRGGRAKKMAKLFDHLMTILPFEPPYFTRHGLASTFVGHPVIESGIIEADGAAFRAQNNFSPNDKILCVLPGSRQSEIHRLMPIFADTISLLRESHPDLKIIIPTTASLKFQIEKYAPSFNVSYITNTTQKYAAFKAANVALATSGTVTLELNVAQVPTVMAYKTGSITGWLVRKLIKIPYFTLTNILLHKEVIPELVQQHCTPEKLSLAVENLLINDVARQSQVRAGKEVRAMLKPADAPPSEKAAQTVLRFL